VFERGFGEGDVAAMDGIESSAEKSDVHKAQDCRALDGIVHGAAACLPMELGRG
jgi:hypothetical protein